MKLTTQIIGWISFAVSVFLLFFVSYEDLSFLSQKILFLSPLPFVFMYSVLACQTALLFPAFYDYRAKLTSAGSGETKIAILTTSGTV